MFEALYVLVIAKIIFYVLKCIQYICLIIFLFYVSVFVYQTARVLFRKVKNYFGVV